MTATYEYVVIVKCADGPDEEVKTFSDLDEAILFRDRHAQEKGLPEGTSAIVYGRRVKGGGR